MQLPIRKMKKIWQWTPNTRYRASLGVYYYMNKFTALIERKKDAPRIRISLY